MKNLIYLFSIIFIFLVISCKKEKQISKYEQLHCINCSEGPSNDHPAYDSISFIKLETNSNCLITDYKQLEMTDSLIFLSDLNHSLYLFDIEGKFISQIGRKGDGPDEYINLSTFYVDNKNGKVVIIDDAKGLFISYDFTGKFLSSTPISLESIRRSSQALLSDNNNLLLYNMMNMNMEDNMAYSVIDLNTGHLKGKYFTYNPIKLNHYLYSFSNHPMGKYEDEIHFIMPLSDTIYSYSKSDFSTKYVFETSKKLIKREQITPNTSNYDSDIFKLGKEGYFTGFTALFETKNKIFLEYKDQGIALGYYLFDKQTKEGNQYLYNYDNTLIKTVPFFRIVYALPNDQLIGIANPDYLLGLKDKLDVNNSSVRQLKEVLDKTKDDDNPILFIYHFK